MMRHAVEQNPGCDGIILGGHDHVIEVGVDVIPAAVP